MNPEDNKADLFRPIYASRVGLPPLVLRTIVVPNNDYLVGGMPSTTKHVEEYVLLSALPQELKERVVTAVKAIIDGM